MNYNIFEYPSKINTNYNKLQIKDLIPSINKRDYRLFSNDIRSDISLIVLRDDVMLIKFGDISAILLEDRCLFFCFNTLENKVFIEYISRLKIDIGAQFLTFIFENILIYLSNNIDIFLEESFNNFSRLSIDNFKTNQLKHLLKFQHKVLIELDKYQEYLESLTKLCKNKNAYKLFSRDSESKNEFEQLLHTYSNQIREDIKNLERLIKKIEIFVDLININLAEKRNRFARNTLNLEIVSFSYSLSLFMIYLLGTNLKNHMENNDYCIIIFALATIVISIPIFFIIRKIFR